MRNPIVRTESTNNFCHCRNDPYFQFLTKNNYFRKGSRFRIRDSQANRFLDQITGYRYQTSIRETEKTLRLKGCPNNEYLLIL